MRRLITALGVVALIAVLSPTAALAKGPESASIDGPGGGGSIDVGGDPGSGEPGSGGMLGRLAQHAGLFAAGFGEHPTRLTAQRPDGDLGPEFRIEWTVPTGDGEADTVVQRLYPYADAGAATYTEPGQQYLGHPTTGGWFVGGRALSGVLDALGVPGQPPARGSAVMRVALGVAGLCALGLLTMLARRTVRQRERAVAI